MNDNEKKQERMFPRPLISFKKNDEILKGDIVTCDGFYVTDPETGKSTDVLMHFVAIGIGKKQ